MNKNIVHVKDNTLFLCIRVLPNAKRSGIEGIWNDTALKVALRAPAVDGLANKALIDFLAELLHVKKREIFIVRGETSREKLVSIQTADYQKIITQIQNFL
ncbi:MAG: YggU family protein [Alphaproteobacteria bacterium]|nr:YggU family protein [Alphaproteobacteria bacterium]